MHVEATKLNRQFSCSLWQERERRRDRASLPAGPKLVPIDSKHRRTRNHGGGRLSTPACRGHARSGEHRRALRGGVGALWTAGRAHLQRRRDLVGERREYTDAPLPADAAGER